MAWKEIVIDGSVGRIGTPQVRVPEGYYLVEGVSVEPTPEDLAPEKKHGYYITVRIISGPDNMPNVGVGGELRDYATMGTENAFFAIGNTLAGFGSPDVAKALEARAKAGQPIRLPSYAHFVAFGSQQVAPRVIGKRSVALISDRTGGNGKQYSNIEGLYPESRWAELKQSQIAVNTLPQSTGSPLSNGAGAAAVASGADLFADLDAAL